MFDRVVNMPVVEIFVVFFVLFTLRNHFGNLQITDIWDLFRIT